MDFITQFLGEVIDLELSGDKKNSGVLIDHGPDILVIFDGTNYLYIPSNHIQHVTKSLKNKDSFLFPSEHPNQHENDISFRKVLNNAKGQFIEIYVAGNQSIHGYITNLLTNYFVFYSPVYKTMFIPLFHLKWLVPYQFMTTPYSLDKILLPIHSSNLSLARTFEEQLKKLEGTIVVFDLGQHAHKIGLLKKIDQNIAELVTADQRNFFCNIQHLKTVHSP